MSDKATETKTGDQAPTDAKGRKYETILVERRERVGLITLNRPKALNALNRQLSQETLKALQEFDADDRVAEAGQEALAEGFRHLAAHDVMGEGRFRQQREGNYSNKAN